MPEPTTPQSKPFSLDGPKILLEGPSGTGKSYSIGTLVEWAAKQSPPLTVHVVYTENSLEALLGFWAKRGDKPPANLRWHVSRIPALSLDSLLKGAKDAGLLSYENLTKSIDPERSVNNPWEKFLTIFTNVPDDRSGEKFGNIGTWGPERILVVDSLTEAAVAAFKMVVGKKVVGSPADYQVAQNNLLGWVRYMTQSFRGTFVMTGHVQRQVNEITGVTTLMTKAIGKALADELPPLFSEVIYCVREGARWTWDTAAFGVDTKTRYLPIASKLDPDFSQIMQPWLERSKQ